jgi:hypothetical protein
MRQTSDLALVEADAHILASSSATQDSYPPEDKAWTEASTLPRFFSPQG